MNESQPLHDQADDPHTFVNLVFGLESYLANRQTIPGSLRHALNASSFSLRDGFPRTLQAFVDMCRQPLETWYRLPVPDEFDPAYPILYEDRLSEEAQDYGLWLTETMALSAGIAPSPTALDNLAMINLRERLKAQDDREAVQRIYVDVRSFLIEHSWATRDQIQDESVLVSRELKKFYEEMPPWPVEKLAVCERCGLLEWRNERWEGLKPRYCSDHGEDSPLVSMVPAGRDLYRLRRGIHLRTFIPGRLERALFHFADAMYDQHPDQLQAVERYPGLDTYDLRLTFSDGAIWAVDAKDHANPERLAKQMTPFYGEGDLKYGEGYYVLPNERMSDPDYAYRLETALAQLPNSLPVVSLGTFQAQVTSKVEALSALAQRGKKTRRKTD